MPNLRPVNAHSLAFAVLATAAVALLAPMALAATEATPPANPAVAQLRQQEIELKNAVRSNPKDPTNHEKLAELYLSVGNYAAAEAEVRQAMSNGGKDDDDAPLLARALLEEGKIGPLIAQVNPGDRSPKAEALVRFALGMARLAEQDEEKAEPLLRDSVRLDPEGWRQKAGLARALIVKHDLDGAAAQIEAARAIAPDEIEIIRMQGELARAKGDPDGAIAAFSKILAKRPTDFLALTSRANAYLVQNKLAEAGKDVDAALKISPKAPSAQYLNALILARQGKLTDADAKLDVLAPAFDSFPAGYYLAGTVKYALGQYELADQYLSKFMSVQPAQPAARRLRALIAMRRGSPQQAIDLLKPVVEANAADTASLAVLARAYIAAGKSDEALQFYEHAAEADGSDPKVQTAAALMQMSFGDVTAGTEQLEKVATSGNTDLAAPLLILWEMRRGDLVKAQQEVDEFVKKDPDNPVVLNLKGSVELAELKLPEAQATFEGLLKKSPDFNAARRNLAQVLLVQNKADEAKAVLLQVLQKFPTDERTLISLADLAISQNNVDEAADRLKAAQAAAPKDPTPSFRLVSLYAGQKDWDKAAEVMRGLQRDYPEDLRVLQLRADLRADQGDIPGAETGYQDIIRRAPNFPVYYTRLAALQNRAGEKEGARTSLEKARAIEPKNRQLMADLVFFDATTKGTDAALATAHAIAPDDPEAEALLSADVLLQAKRNDDALKILEAEQQARPTGTLAARIAQLLYGGGKADEARTLLTAWTKDHDKDVAGRLALADLDMREKKDDDARALYESVEKLSPGNVLALNNLAVLYSRIKDPRAAPMAIEAYEHGPGPQTADTLGWILANSGRPEVALSYLRQANAGLPNNGTIEYHLAAALNGVGKKDEARKLLEQVMKTNAAFEEKPDAQHLLDTLQHG